MGKRGSKAKYRVYKLARRVLGRRGTFILRNIVSEIMFRLNRFPPTNEMRPFGISAMVVTYNESDWIEPSMLSIKDLVDEYVVVDSSTDETPNIIRRVAEEHGLNVKLYRIPPGDLVAARNKVLKESSYRWILHWDADFIARDDTSKFLRSFLEGLDERRYYLIYWRNICLDIDIFHQNPKVPFHIEHWIFTYSDKLRYVWIGKDDTLVAPLSMYKAIYIDKILAFHLRTVRNPVRLLYKFMYSKMRREGKQYSMSLDDYVKIKIRELYGTSSVEEAAKIHLQYLLKETIPYDREKYGDYPRVLKEYVRRKYGIKL